LRELLGTEDDDGKLEELMKMKDEKNQSVLHHILGTKEEAMAVQLIRRAAQARKMKEREGGVADEEFNMVNAVDSWAASCLHIACSQGHVEVVRELLGGLGREAGFSMVNAVDHGGWSCLHVACSYGHVEVARELLGGLGREAGFNMVNAVNNHGLSCLHLACGFGRRGLFLIQMHRG
jgi:ankyrin repeat protein